MVEIGNFNKNDEPYIGIYGSVLGLFVATLSIVQRDCFQDDILFTLDNIGEIMRMVFDEVQCTITIHFNEEAANQVKKISLHKSEKNLLINRLTLEPPDEKIHEKKINEEKKNSGSIHIRKSAQIENLKNIALQKEFLPIIKKLMLDGNIIDHNILKEIKKDIQKEETKAEINETNENIKDEKDKAIIKINGRKEEIKLNINREKRSNATAKEIMNDYK